VLVAILYEIMGVVIAWIVKQVFWVPHRFRFGLLVAGGWGNYGEFELSPLFFYSMFIFHCDLIADIPTSVIMSITGAAPFSGTSDQTLAVAYVSAFILVFFVSFTDPLYWCSRAPTIILLSRLRCSH